MLDDEMHTVEAIGLALKDEGCVIEEVVTVGEAQKVLSDQSSIDLFILDVMMSPGPLDTARSAQGFKTGVEVFTMARRFRSELPFVVLTNTDDQEVLEFFHQQTRCKLFKKEALLPRHAAKHVQDFLDSLRPETESL